MKSDNRIPILVTGASGIVGYGILKCLRQGPRAVHLIGTSIYSDSVASAFCDQFEVAPRTEDPEYLEWLIGLSKRHGVQVLMPGLEADVYGWNESRHRLTGEGLSVVLNSSSLLERTQDKWSFYRELETIDSPYRIPSSLDTEWERASQRLGCPLLLKPRRGYASRGILRVDSESQWAQQGTRVGKELMAQQIVGRPDAEFTVSAFGDGLGNITALIALRRELSSEGFTLKAELCRWKPLETAVRALSEHFRPLGPTNFQFRVERDRPYLLEINPRISSSVSIRCALGYNEPAMALEHCLCGHLPKQPFVRSGRAIRYWEDHVFYETAGE